MIALTGATGQLGRIVVERLLESTPAAEIVAAVRNPEKAAVLKSSGVQIRHADYSAPHSLDASFSGIDRLLLISANEVGQRVNQHRNVVDAAKRRGVKLLVYTSILHADTSILSLASEHLETERIIKASGIPAVILRNGWYNENYTDWLSATLEKGGVYGAAGSGKFSFASRADYAAAAANALVGKVPPGTYELAGDTAITLADLAAEISRQTGKNIPYHNLSESDFLSALKAAGLPELLAQALSNSDACASKGALFDDSRQLSRLIGRPTTPISASVKHALHASK